MKIFAPLLILILGFSFTIVNRAGLTPDTETDGISVYLYAIPDAPYQIIKSIPYNAQSEISYTDLLEVVKADATQNGLAIDGLMIRDGRTAHAIVFDDPAAARTGKAIMFNNWSIFFRATPTGVHDQVATLDFNQHLSPTRSHSQMMTEMMDFLKGQEIEFNGIQMDGDQHLTLISLK